MKFGVRQTLLLVGIAVATSVFEVVFVRLMLSPSAPAYRFFWEAHLSIFIYSLLGLLLLAGLDYLLHRRGRRFHTVGFYTRLLLLGAVLYVPLAVVVSFSTEALFWGKHRYLMPTGAFAWFQVLRESFVMLFNYLLFSFCYVFLRYLQEENALQQRLRDAERRRREAEVRALRQHVNPHFLFNSLHVLSALIELHNEPAQRYLHHLAQLYRLRLRQQAQDVVPLAEELTGATDLLYLLGIRFGEAYRFEQHLLHPARLTDSLVPPGAVQELLHNAVKHNDASLTHPVTIGLTVYADAVEISNTRQPHASPSLGTGGGLSNLRQQLHLLTPLPLLVTETAHHFSVRLPLIPLVAREDE